MIKSFAIFSTKAEGNQPTHLMYATIHDKKTVVGSLWAKTWTKDGNTGTYLSGEMKKPYMKDGIELTGYVILSENEYNMLKALAENAQPKEPSAYDQLGSIDPADIPF